MIRHIHTYERVAPLRDFLAQFTQLVEEKPREATLLQRGADLLRILVKGDDWLDDAYAQPGETYYQQYLLYCDPLERFQVISFVWGAGQKTPIHDHRMWGLIGILRGGEHECRYDWRDGVLREGESRELHPGMVAAISTEENDIHRVSNLYQDRCSVSIHVYGGNTSRVQRAAYDVSTGKETLFVSTYANDALPNIWSPQPDA